MKQETGAVDDPKGQKQLGGLVQERVMLCSEFARLCEVFGGEDVGIGRGEERGRFVVGLVGPLSRGSGFSGGDCERRIARFGESRRRGRRVRGSGRCRRRFHDVEVERIGSSAGSA